MRSRPAAEKALNITISMLPVGKADRHGPVETWIIGNG
jgi:hypothetical protein